MSEQVRKQARWIGAIGVIGGMLFGSMEAVETGYSIYHGIRADMSENRDEMISDNMWLIEHIEELEERLEALEAQL
jgi:hypothetical protein